MAIADTSLGLILGLLEARLDEIAAAAAFEPEVLASANAAEAGRIRTARNEVIAALDAYDRAKAAGNVDQMSEGEIARTVEEALAAALPQFRMDDFEWEGDSVSQRITILLNRLMVDPSEGG